METQRLLCTPLVIAVFAAAGCQTAPLGGTRWNVIEFVEPDEADRARLNEIHAMMIDFRPNGQLITSIIRDDGSVEVNDQERYRVKGEVVTIKGPKYNLKAMYRFEDDQLRLHAEQFVMQMKPIR